APRAQALPRHEHRRAAPTCLLRPLGECGGTLNIAELFVRRPVMTLLVMTGVLIFGIIGYRLLPVNALPNVDFPTIQVQAQLPGANPDTMASAVATPLE